MPKLRPYAGFLFFLTFVLLSKTVLASANLSQCALSLRQIMKHTFEDHQILKSQNHYLWDNWSFYNPKNQTYYRYSLSAHKSVGDADTRHANARIRVFTSNNAQNWKDEGLVWSDDLTWSGQSFFDSTQDRTLLFHTRSRQTSDDVIQKISVAESSDGIHFSNLRTLLDPEDPATRLQAEQMGYHLGRGDGLVMAWRDPYFFENQLFFASKAQDPRTGKVVPIVARARSSQNLQKFDLEKPIFLPLENSITQVELPNIKRLPDGRYLMSVNLSDRITDSTPSLDVKTWVRFYTADSIDGPWKTARGASLDSNGNLFVPEDRVYGFNLTGNTPDSQIMGSGFFRRGGQDPHALTPLINVDVAY